MPILPGQVLGILGGGQLGRMTALAARSLGYRLAVLDPDPRCSARPVVETCLTASFDDPAAAEALAEVSDVVTLEIEKVSLEGLERAARKAPVRPGRALLEVVNDRGRQKAWLQKHGFPVGPVEEVHSAAALRSAAERFGPRLFVKRTFGGYDGRGQAELEGPQQAEAVWRLLGEAPCVAEEALVLELELSVMVARRPSGETAVYPPALNHHEERILAHSLLPGPLPPRVAAQAQELARAVAERIGLEGILAVEMFLTKDGRLLVNELAPRPHNSYHGADLACLTSQFEQHVRAVCDLPLGSTEAVRPSAILNLLGDLWVEGREPDWAAALALPGVRLTLYGKGDARPGRKMGHLSATGSSGEDALGRLQAAYARLQRR
jgi:5-(carboxyamino)imidazole ribonucleotide synthase